MPCGGRSSVWLQGSPHTATRTYPLYRHHYHYCHHHRFQHNHLHHHHLHPSTPFSTLLYLCITLSSLEPLPSFLSRSSPLPRVLVFSIIPLPCIFFTLPSIAFPFSPHHLHPLLVLIFSSSFGRPNLISFSPLRLSALAFPASHLPALHERSGWTTDLYMAVHCFASAPL